MVLWNPAQSASVAPGRSSRNKSLSSLTLTYCGKAEFGQISRSLSSNSGAILLKRPKNLTQIGFPSLRSVKPDRLLDKKGAPDGAP